MSFFGIPIRNGLSLGLGTVASLTNGPGFLPDELFYGGTVQGAWYDPSDLTTLFQDSAGTTPVTAVEQAVGLMLDKSKGLVLGPELVTNGTFDTNTNGWSLRTGSDPTTGGSITWSSGTLRFSRGTTFPSVAAAQQITGFTVGKWYVVSGLARIVSGATNAIIQLRTADGGGGSDLSSANAVTTSSSFTLVRSYWLATQTSAWISLLLTNDNTAAEFDNISVRELPGNHAYQSTSASRPTLRARYNLLRYSEEFDNAYWFKANSSISANVAVAPDGTTTGDKLVENTANNQHWVGGASTGVALVSGASYTVSVYAKQGERGYIKVYGDAGSGSLGLGATFNLTNGTIFSTAVGATASITSVGNGWYRCVVTSTATGSTNLYPYVGLRQDSNPSADSYIGDGTSGAFIWGLQALVTAVFPSNTYQRIGAATDYATGAAFPPYLFFDGTDDSMLTNSVDFATVTSDGQARRNLLLNPTQFDTAVWNKGTGGSISANTVVAPDGTLTADAYTWATSTASFAYLDQTVSGNATVTHTYSIWLKRPVGSGSRNLKLVITDFTLTTGVSADFTVTETWQRFTFSRTSANNTGFVGAGITLASSGSIAAGEVLDAWGAQLETGSTATAFQNIGTDKMLVVAGVTKSSDAAFGCITELTANGYTTAGGFYSIAAGGAGVPGAFYGSALNGSTGYAADFQTFTAPITNVITQQMDIAQPTGATELTLRVNGVSATRGTTAGTTAGTGNFANAPLYIGRRNNASIPLNGNLYSLIIAGQSYSSGQISSTESWVAAKTPLGTI